MSAVFKGPNMLIQQHSLDSLVRNKGKKDDISDCKNLTKGIFVVVFSFFCALLGPPFPPFLLFLSPAPAFGLARKSSL